MDEYAASRSRVEKLKDAVEAIKESFTCRICLEFFKEPVTIKCGHKFCRSCILTVASNENAACPFCNIKIQKRSIAKKGNELLQACVEQFHELTKAIESDSGIDVLESCKNVKNTKESILCDKSSASKESSTNQKSIKSRTNLRCSTKLSLQKKQVINKVKLSSDKNTLHKYLSNPSDCIVDQVQSEEKVKNWLQNLTPSDSVFRDSDHRDCDKSSITQSKQDITDFLPEVDPDTTKSKESIVSSAKSVNEKNDELKYKEVQARIQEVEMNAKRKKSNLSLPDKTVLKTPSSVPASSHSDAYDWRRVKKVGKEMQVKTFKSLSVSIEKSSPSIILDDTVPCDSSNNDSKNISREIDTNHYSSNYSSVETIQKKLLNESDTQHKENQKNIKDYNSKQGFINTSNSHKDENISLSSIDQKQINEIIGLGSQTKVNTPEKTRDTSNASNQEYVSKLNRLSPLNINPASNQENNVSDDKSPNIDGQSNIINVQTSPLPKNKLSLKMKLTLSDAKSVRSQSNTPDKTSQTGNESPKNISPERPKSRLSLRLPNTKSSEYHSSKVKSPLKNLKSPVKSSFNKKSLDSSNRSVIVFKKLGKICKKRKNVPFLYLGKIWDSNKRQSSGIIVKSNVPTNIDYKSLMGNTNSKSTSTVLQTINTEVKVLSPEKDSQLKFLTIDSPRHQQNIQMSRSECKNITCHESEQSVVPMEIDERFPSVSNISKYQLNFQQEHIENSENSDVDVESESSRSKILNIQEKFTKENSEINVRENEISFKTNPNVIKASNILSMNQPETFLDSESDEKDNKFEKSQNSNQTYFDHRNVKIDKKENDVISISSNESKSKKTESHNSYKSENIRSKRNNKNKNFVIESNTDSESSLMNDPKENQNSEKEKSICTSTSSSPIKTALLKKKRTYSESSSNDDDDVSSIIDKWVGTMKEPLVKKPKITSHVSKHLNLNQSKNKFKRIEDSSSDSDNDNTIVDTALKQSEISKPQSDPLIDNIISTVKSYRENAAGSNKLINMPSSLSRDLFESNEQCIQSRAQILPQKSNNDNSLVRTWSPKKKSNEENVNTSQDLSDITMLDLMKFEKEKSNISENTDGSDKENSECNQVNVNTKAANDAENHTDEIKSSQNDRKEEMKNQSHSSQFDSCHVSDSTLMNITQEQLALKKIEKALIGVNLSTIQNNITEEISETNKFETPKKVKHCQKSNIDDDFDTDNIDATPVTKRRHRFNFPTSKSTDKKEKEKDISERFSSDNSFNLIPAVTPVKNTKSYPLSHSTPMMNTSNSNDKTSTHPHITLICSGLRPENIQTIQSFANKFRARFESNFSSEVTHVIVQTDPKTKAGHKTFKYIQGIAFKKYVISFQWVVDCLKQNRLVNEDDEKYEVLDPELFEPGSKKSRTRTQDLFEGFAIYCLEPFTSFPLNDFKSLLLYNGAVIIDTLQELSLQKDILKIVIFESELVAQEKLSILKKSGSALISYDWIVDSISQYQILSLFPYLFKTTTEEALALGFPPEYLVEEETIDDEEEDES